MVPCLVFLVDCLCGGLFAGSVFHVVCGFLFNESSFFIVLAWIVWMWSYSMVVFGGT